VKAKPLTKEGKTKGERGTILAKNKWGGAGRGTVGGKVRKEEGEALYEGK